MKKFVYLYYGYNDADQGSMDDWKKWMGTLGDKLVDVGNPFSEGRLVTANGAKDDPKDATSVTGYSIVNAADMAEAEQMLKGCPASEVRIYEAMPM